MPRKPQPRDRPTHEVSWPINDLRVQAHLAADGLWRIRVSGLVNGEFRSNELTAQRGELAAGAQRAVALFEIVHQNTKESL